MACEDGVAPTSPDAAFDVWAASHRSASPVFPDVFPLPDGWQPEGIATGYGTTFYAGSLAGSGLYRGDFRTGAGEVLDESDGTLIAGVAFDARTGFVFAAGGPAGDARVHDGTTGAVVATYPLAGAGLAFVNDVVVTRDAAYFTDSFNAVFYRIPLGPGGSLPDPAEVEAIALGGDWMQVAGFNANGIEATPDGRTLIIVHSSLGTLYTVDTLSGEATQIDLGGDAVPSGDGLLLDGKTLYVVLNFSNQIAVVELDADLSSGLVVATLTDPAFDIPTTVAKHGSALYAVNARFSTPPGPAVEYDVVRVSK
jgi:sugar lactone lactonase YvrE